MRDLKAPAVSNALRGETKNSIIDVQEDPMNLTITTETGKARKHRATIQSEDGTQGVFCEADDLNDAVAKVISSPSAAAFEEATRDPRRFVAYGQEEIRRLFETAIEQRKYVNVVYTDTQGTTTRRTIFPLRFSPSGSAVEGRNAVTLSERSYRRLLLSRITSAKIDE